MVGLFFSLSGTYYAAYFLNFFLLGPRVEKGSQFQ